MRLVERRYKTDIIKGDHYTITYGKSQASIDGQSDITIGGRHKLYINKDGALNIIMIYR